MPFNQNPNHNANPFRLGCANGVLCLQTGEFVENTSDDIVTFKLGRTFWSDDAIPYTPYDPTDPVQGEIDTYMASVFPDSELQAYMWRKFASYLEGTNREGTLDIWHGAGSNGKTLLSDLLRATLGDYAEYIHTYMTYNTADNSINGSLMRFTNRRRFIVTNLGSSNEILPLIRIRQFTGAEPICAMTYYGDEHIHALTGKVVIQCNTLPPLPTDSLYCIQVIPFESVFERNTDLVDRMYAWRAQFLSRLVYIYRTEYAVGGLGPTPAIVEERSVAYRGAMTL